MFYIANYFSGLIPESTPSKLPGLTPAQATPPGKGVVTLVFDARFASNRSILAAMSLVLNGVLINPVNYPLPGQEV